MSLTPANLDSLGAIILTGGTAVRLDGADKASIELHGHTLLERALATVNDLPTVVVGPELRTSRPVTFRREDPPGGGPAAGVIAGLNGFTSAPDSVVVIAVDMPHVCATTISRLREAAIGHHGALLVDAGGRHQPLCAVYSVAALQTGSRDDAQGMSMRRLTASLRLATVAAHPEEASDVDTWDDLQRLRELPDHSRLDP